MKRRELFLLTGIGAATLGLTACSTQDNSSQGKEGAAPLTMPARTPAAFSINYDWEKTLYPKTRPISIPLMGMAIIGVGTDYQPKRSHRVEVVDNRTGRTRFTGAELPATPEETPPVCYCSELGGEMFVLLHSAESGGKSVLRGYRANSVGKRVKPVFEVDLAKEGLGDAEILSAAEGVTFRKGDKAKYLADDYSLKSYDGPGSLRQRLKGLFLVKDVDGSGFGVTDGKSMTWKSSEVKPDGAQGGGELLGYVSGLVVAYWETSEEKSVNESGKKSSPTASATSTQTNQSAGNEKQYILALHQQSNGKLLSTLTINQQTPPDSTQRIIANRTKNSVAIGNNTLSTNAKDNGSLDNLPQGSSITCIHNKLLYTQSASDKPTGVYTIQGEENSNPDSYELSPLFVSEANCGIFISEKNEGEETKMYSVPEN